VDLAVSGPATESFFAPTGCNVHLVAVVDRSTVRMRTWERGAGLTTACGSGACAAAYVLYAGGLVDDVVEVRMPGGTATVTVGDTVRLAGTATFVDVHSVDLPADHVGVLGNGGPDNG
jgi:diaminopimelate epimerase